MSRLPLRFDHLGHDVSELSNALFLGLEKLEEQQEMKFLSTAFGRSWRTTELQNHPVCGLFMIVGGNRSILKILPVDEAVGLLPWSILIIP